MTRIKNPYIRNLFFSVDDVPTNPLVHIFLYITLAFGVSFVFFPVATGAVGSVLYIQTAASFGGLGLNLWGVACIIATIVNTYAYMVRQKLIGQTACYMGWAVWTFSFILYGMAGYWFGALVVSLPNLMFWTWQFILVGRYHRAFHSGVKPVAKNTTANDWKNKYAGTKDDKFDGDTRSEA